MSINGTGWISWEEEDFGDSKLYARPLFGVLLESNLLEQMKATLNTERNWSITVKSSANPMRSSETELSQIGEGGEPLNSWINHVDYLQEGSITFSDIQQRTVSGEGLYYKPSVTNSQQVGGMSVLVLTEGSGQHNTIYTTISYINEGDSLNYMCNPTNFLRIPKAIGKKVMLRSNHLKDEHN